MELEKIVKKLSKIEKLENILEMSSLSDKKFNEFISVCIANSVIFEIIEKQDFDFINNKDEIDSISTYLTDIKNINLISINSLYKITKKEKFSDEDIEIIVSQKLLTVAYIALNHMKNNVNFLDLVQEGNIGLIKGIKFYDAGKGYDFDYILNLWIENYIIKYVKSIENENTNIKKTIKIYKKIMKSSDTNDEDMQKLEKLMIFISGKENNEEYESLLEKLKILSEVEREIIKLSFGLNTKTLSNKEISEKLEISKEDVEVFKTKALQHLKDIMEN